MDVQESRNAAAMRSDRSVRKQLEQGMRSAKALSVAVKGEAGRMFGGGYGYAPSVGVRPGRPGPGFASLGPRIRPALGWVAS